MSKELTKFPNTPSEYSGTPSEVASLVNKLLAERDDLARQLGDITAGVAASTHLPQRDTIAETIRAADDRIGALASSSSHPIAEVVGEEFKALASHVGIGKHYEEASRQRVTPMSPRALASIIKDWCYRRSKWEASQARQETLREVAKAMGAEEAYDAMVSLLGSEKTTPECFVEMLRMCAASSPAEVALQFKAAKAAKVEHPGILFTITEGDPFAGIMDGPEMMPLGDDEGDR